MPADCCRKFLLVTVPVPAIRTFRSRSLAFSAELGLQLQVWEIAVATGRSINNRQLCALQTRPREKGIAP
jgi:hypothetical protein